ncbi:hypothetical protein [Nocardioides sp.]|uniref:hypothetical protein n=1 Tax=Nocardioides sp. TaxID=35761 RepID=UPI0035188183
MPRVLLPLLGLLTVAATTGCDAGSAPPSTDDVRAGLVRLYEADDAVTDEIADQAGCFADALLADLGVEGLADAGIIEDGRVVTSLPVLPEDDAAAWVDAQGGCVSYTDAAGLALSAQSKGRLDVAAFTRCFEAAVSPAQVRAAQIAALTAALGDPAVTALTDAQATCARAALPPD